MRCKRCNFTPPATQCEKDCEECEHESPMDGITHPCCVCLRYEVEQLDQGTSLERWIKSEVAEYSMILAEGSLDKYSPDGHKRLISVLSLAQRLSKRLIQKKTLAETDDTDLHERITHYVTLYEKTLRYETTIDYDIQEELLVDIHAALHPLMRFFNEHYGLNYNLGAQTKAKNTPIEEQVNQIQKTIENGGRPRSC